MKKKMKMKMKKKINETRTRVEKRNVKKNDPKGNILFQMIN